MDLICIFAERNQLKNIDYATNQLFLRDLILMNFSDHNPPHFHAWYGDYKVTVSIKDSIVKGEMPGRALRLILEWLDLHREELMDNWTRAQKGGILEKIEPLK